MRFQVYLCSLQRGQISGWFLVYFWLQIDHMSRSEESADMTMSVSDGRADGRILRASATASSSSPSTALTATTSKAFHGLQICIILEKWNILTKTVYLNAGKMQHLWSVGRQRGRVVEMPKGKCAHCPPLVDILQLRPNTNEQSRLETLNTRTVLSKMLEVIHPFIHHLPI